MDTPNNQTPLNRVVEEVKAWEERQSLVSQLNREAERCRTIHSPTLREGCYIENVIPLMVRVQKLGYSLEYVMETGEYKPTYTGEESQWVHPTANRR